MSSETSETADAVLRAAPVHSVPGHASGAPGHASAQSYLTGFAASVILTAVPFALVMAHALPAAGVVPTIVALGVVQIVVHLVYFLHMNSSSSQTWNNAAFLFTVVIVSILVCGSLWIMYHLNANMMPGMMPPD
ncbi:MAG: cytochrome o ubiquinol oxidase subunit IV [Alphaproteobacteria bacterium]|nr:cytochrome o ubiquinol oxidase subunit IV [Alphaproteobacteria bacterium]